MAENPGPHIVGRPEPGRDLTFSLVGIGKMGWGLAYQAMLTPGIKCVAAADFHVERAKERLASINIEAHVVDSADAVADCVRAGKFALVEDANHLVGAPGVDIFCDASTALEPAYHFCHRAIDAGHHIVMMNSEADLAYGPEFLAACDKKGMAYTSCDGDQHGVLIRLLNEVELWGFEMVGAFNIKGFLRTDATPTIMKPEAEKRGLDVIMCTAYTDGTKLNIEMALLANALGYKTLQPGMQGPRAKHIQETFDLFDLEDMHRRGPAVDYVLGAQPDGGVFVVAHHDQPFQRDMMKYYKMGDGPYYLFYRHCHLCHVESMRSMIEAAAGWPMLAPWKGRVTDVESLAKRDLKAGETLDGIGGECCRGVIVNMADHATGEAAPLPICAVEGLKLKNDKKKDEGLTWADVEIPANRPDLAAQGAPKR